MKKFFKENYYSIVSSIGDAYIAASIQFLKEVDTACTSPYKIMDGVKSILQTSVEAILTNLIDIEITKAMNGVLNAKYL